MVVNYSAIFCEKYKNLDVLEGQQLKKKRGKEVVDFYTASKQITQTNRKAVYNLRKTG